MSYEPTIWKKGDKVTSTKLNKIENGIQGNDEEITSIKEGLNEILVEESSGQEAESVTLTTILDVSNFGVGGNLHRETVSGNMVTLEPDASNTDTNIYCRKEFSVGEGKYLVGFKYRLRKADDTLSNPNKVTTILGASTRYENPNYVYGEWMEFHEVANVNLTRVYFAIQGFPVAPVRGQLYVDVTDIYCYEISECSDAMISLIIAEQNEHYASGTVTYSIEGTDGEYVPDKTLSLSGKVADSRATGDAINVINSKIFTTKTVSLSNLNNNAHFFSDGSLGYISSTDGVATFAPNANADSNLYMRNSISLGVGKHLVSFKYRLTKMDETLTDPQKVRITLGASEYYDNSGYEYNTWINFTQITNIDLTRVYFTIIGFATVPTKEQFKVEVKEFYVYDVEGLDPDQITYVISEQDANYKSGVVIYSNESLSDIIKHSFAQINVKDYGVSGDGVTDDTDAIRAVLLKGSGTYYFPTGTYIITGTIFVPDDSVIFGDGDSTVFSFINNLTISERIFRESQRALPYILVEGKNVVLKQFKVIGGEPLLQNRHAGIGVFDSERVIIEDLTVHNVNYNAEQDVGDSTGYGILVNRSKYITVQRCDVRGCGYECIGIVDDCDYCTVRDCYTQDGWRTCIQVHRGSCNTTVENCYMKQTHPKYDACFTVHGLPEQMVNNLRVINCIAECTVKGIQGEGYCAPYQIMSDAECLVFVGNRVVNGYRAFYINDSSSNAKIIGNDFHCSDQSDYGVTIRSLDSIVIGNRLVNDAETHNIIVNSPILIGNIGIS